MCPNCFARKPVDFRKRKEESIWFMPALNVLPVGRSPIPTSYTFRVTASTIANKFPQAAILHKDEYDNTSPYWTITRNQVYGTLQKSSSSPAIVLMSVQIWNHYLNSFDHTEWLFKRYKNMGFSDANLLAISNFNKTKPLLWFIWFLYHQYMFIAIQYGKIIYVEVSVCNLVRWWVVCPFCLVGTKALISNGRCCVRLVSTGQTVCINLPWMFHHSWSETLRGVMVWIIYCGDSSELVLAANVVVLADCALLFRSFPFSFELT